MTDQPCDESSLGCDPDGPGRAEAGTARQLGYFVMRFGEVLYAFPDRDVSFVANVTRPTRIPTAPDVFLGVVHVRGHIVAVVDLPRALGLPPPAPVGPEERLDQRLIVLQSRDRFAVVADAALGQHWVSSHAVRTSASDALDSAGGGRTSFVEGEFDHPQGVVTVLSAAALLQDLGQDRTTP